jgi:hydroxymethylglutaryl-CoA reductase
MTSRLPGFFEKSPEERRAIIADRIGSLPEPLTLERADQMVENAIGVFGLPLAVAPNFVVDHTPVLVPMVIEEPSVVAAASRIAKLVALNGGFTTQVDEPLMLGQIQLVSVPDIEGAVSRLARAKPAIMAVANISLKSLVARGGGCVDVLARVLPPRDPALVTPCLTRSLEQDDVLPETQLPFLMVELVINCCDAMGANLINTALEAVSDDVAQIAGGRAVFRILSNLSDRRLARAFCEIPYRALATDVSRDNGRHIAQNIVLGYELAMRDPYRAATHNKGIMNGIDAVLIATGNDWRAAEAGAHAFAARTGHYQSLSHYTLDDKSSVLRCSIELPLAVGVVGGATAAHPTVIANLKMLGSFGESSKKLAGLVASVGLAQNMGAMRALAAEGIQRGHMALHRRKWDAHAHRV